MPENTKKWLSNTAYRLAISISSCFFINIAHAQTTIAASTGHPPSQITSQIHTLIDNYHRILSLQGLDSNTPQHQDAVRIGQFLFFENQRLSASMSERLQGEIQRGDQHEFNELLDTLADTNLQDADLFALRNLINYLAEKENLTPQQAGPLRAILKSIAHAHAKYGNELTEALNQPITWKNKPERPEWVAYLSQIEKNYPPLLILKELEASTPNLEQQSTPSEKTAGLAEETRHNEWQGFQLDKGDVLLTFDDGPHPVYTRQILAILARYHVKAIFFQLGQNLGVVRDGHAELTHNEDVEAAILNDGHAIGNHSFTHPFLPKLDQAQIEQEIDQTQALLNLVIPEDSHRTHMFRAPYGARNPLVLGELGERGLRSVLWNIDSLDWSDPIPESIVHRILQELDHNGRGIILMHDIHAKTVIALPILLDQLVKRGYHFVHWDGKNLVKDKADLAISPLLTTPSEK